MFALRNYVIIKFFPVKRLTCSAFHFIMNYVTPELQKYYFKRSLAKGSGMEMNIMERNYNEEIDSLRKQMENFQNTVFPQLDELREMVMKRLPNKPSEPSTEKLERVYVMHGMHPDSRLSEQMEDLCYKTEEKKVSGFVTYLGVYNSGGRQFNWIRNSVPTDELLTLIESGIAGKVLACIGNANRLEMLLEILRGPKTVASLVEKCGFGSTGQVYHHLKPLLAAEIVMEDAHQKGVYIIQSNKVQGIIMLLTGISDLVDETYTQGAWEEDGEN